MNYYNDNDPKACAWLRELIAAGELPAGDVDGRSILEIKADELRGYDQCHFFAGIGGWALALRWAGLEGVRGIWTGSCPCQPLSCAGKRQGHTDERHLWPAFYSLIAECRPATVFGEQVASKDGREWFAGVRLDLEGLGYACGGADLCAAGVGAPHRRQRLFWVADANMPGCDQRARGGQQPIRDDDLRTDAVADVQREGLEGQRGHGDGRREPGRLDAEAVGHAAEGGATGRVGDAGLPKSPGRGDNAGVREEVSGRRQESRNESAPSSRATGFWDACDILPCRDGKARRVEAGTFPLADGIPGRMGLLRGYGNAIVPQVAAEFIGAWLDLRSAASAGRGDAKGEQSCH